MTLEAKADELAADAVASKPSAAFLACKARVFELLALTAAEDAVTLEAKADELAADAVA